LIIKKVALAAFGRMRNHPPEFLRKKAPVRNQKAAGVL
jgi:hypothetical protein